MFFSFSFLFIFLSGATSLIYQVLWHRYLSQLLGSDALATSLVLSLFFLFTALGYEILGKKGFRWMKNKLLLYAWLEAIIGLYALLSPFLFQQIEKISTPQSLFFQILLSSLFIAFPTFLMGGSLPFLTQGLSFSFKNSHIVHAKIYAVNSFGAFVGCLFAGFYLIEKFGLSWSLILTGQVNLLFLPLLFLLSLFYQRKKKWSFEGFSPPPLASSLAEPTKITASLPETQTLKKNPQKTRLSIKSFLKTKKCLLLISFFSGFYVFVLENLLIRITQLSIGSLTYSYSMIVASFIFSLGLGSFLVSYLKESSSFRPLILLQTLIFMSFYALYLSFPKWPFILNRLRHYIFPSEANFLFYCLLIFLGLLVLLVLPISLAGAQLPLLFKYLKNKKEALSPVVGQLYSINAIGCACGSFMGGYLLLYFLSLFQMFQLIFFALLLNFALLLWLVFKQSKKIPLLSTSLLFFFSFSLFFLPSWKEKHFLPPLFNANFYNKDLNHYSTLVKKKQNEQHEILYSHFGPNAYTHVTENKDESRTLYINAQGNANTKRDSGVRSLNILIPILLSPEPKNIFVIGLGVGLSTSIATRFKETLKVDVAEISWSVIQALPFFKKHTQGLKRPAKGHKDKKDQKALSSLSPHSAKNHKWTLFYGDAYRKIKQARKESYDIIISEPSHPWMLGVEKLYSLEFLSLAKDKLKKNGIYAQWFPLFEINPMTFLTILNNFNLVFDWTYLFSTSSSTLLIVNSPSPININPTQIRQRFEEGKNFFEKIGKFQNPFSVLGLQVMSPVFTKGLTYNLNRRHSFDSPKLAFESARSRFANRNTNLQSLLYSKFKKALKPSFPKSLSEKSLSFLYEDLPQPLDPSFYEEVLNYTKTSEQDSSLKFQRNRIKYLYRKFYNTKEAKKRVKENVFQIYAYLSGLSSKNPSLSSPLFLNPKLKAYFSTSRKPSSQSKKENLQYEKILGDKVLQWIKVYKNLLIMQIPTIQNRLNDIFPEKCERKICIKLKEKIKNQLL